MSDSITVDTARLPLLLQELRLPTVAGLWQQFTERADREGWPSARLLAALAELELAERAQRRIQRHLLEARLPSGKTLDSFDFATVPMVSRPHVNALASGDTWLAKGANILLFGPSGSGKSHLGAAIGHALVENGYRVLFTRTTDLVQRLQTARQTPSPIDAYFGGIYYIGPIFGAFRGTDDAIDYYRFLRDEIDERARGHESDRETVDRERAHAHDPTPKPVAGSGQQAGGH